MARRACGTPAGRAVAARCHPAAGAQPGAGARIVLRRGRVSLISPLVRVGSGCSGSKCVALADVDTLAMLALLGGPIRRRRSRSSLGRRGGRLRSR